MWAKAKARAEAKRLERGEPVPSHCSECRLNPERYAEEERRKLERRTAKRRAATGKS